MLPLLLFILLSVQVIGFSLLLLLGRKYREVVKEHGNPFRFKGLAPASLWIVDYYKVTERISAVLVPVHHKLITLYGKKDAAWQTKLFAAQLISASFVILLLITIMSMVSGGDALMLLVGLPMIVLTPLLLIKELDQQVKKKRRTITMELPEFISKVTLLVNSGETVQNAIVRSIDDNKNSSKHPLYAELSQVKKELDNHYSFAQVMDELSKRCAVHEVSVFCTVVLMSYRRGGDEFVHSLRELSRSLWEKRKIMAKTLGEEASSKLVFPMVITFVVLMAIVSAPAFMLMKQ